MTQNAKFEARTGKRIIAATRRVERDPQWLERADYGSRTRSSRSSGAISSGVGSTISFKVTGNHIADAVYVGKSFTDVPAGADAADVAPSGALAESDVGTLAGANNVLILNLVELGSSQTGHDVTATVNTDHFSLYGTGRVAHINEDGTMVVHAALYYVGCVDG